MENITEYVDQVVSKLEGIHSDTVHVYNFISKYKVEGFKYIKDTQWITQNGTLTHIDIPTDNAPTGYVYKQVVCHIYVIDFKGVKYYGVDIDTYKGRPNLAALFNKSIPETKGIKWTKSVDNIKAYITYVLEKYDELNTIPPAKKDIWVFSYFFTDEFLNANLKHIESLVMEYYKNKWIEVKNAYIDYKVSNEEKSIDGLEKEIIRIKSVIDSIKVNIEELKNSKVQIEAE